MKHFIDGDQICVTLDDFINLQESPAVFILAASSAGKAVLAGGLFELSMGQLRDLLSELLRQRKVKK